MVRGERSSFLPFPLPLNRSFRMKRSCRFEPSFPSAKGMRCWRSSLIGGILVHFPLPGHFDRAMFAGGDESLRRVSADAEHTPNQAQIGIGIIIGSNITIPRLSVRRLCCRLQAHSGLARLQRSVCCTAPQDDGVDYPTCLLSSSLGFPQMSIISEEMGPIR